MEEQMEIRKTTDHEILREAQGSISRPSDGIVLSIYHPLHLNLGQVLEAVVTPLCQSAEPGVLQELVCLQLCQQVHEHTGQTEGYRGVVCRCVA